MDFELGEEYQLFRTSTRDFLGAHCDKRIVRQLESTESGHDPKLWARMVELGWTGIGIPEAYGGEGWGLLGTAVLFEEIGRAAFDSALFATFLGAEAVLRGGSESLKQEILPKVASGEKILTLAWAEPSAVADPRYIAATAHLEDGAYAIRGCKLFVPYALVADQIVVAARTRGSVGEEEGITLFLVDRESEGLRIASQKTMAPDKQFRLDLDGVRVASDRILGAVDAGLPLLRAVQDRGAALQCAELVGGAEHELETTAAYTKERIQFDRPLGTFQVVQHRIADMFIDVQGARWTTYQAVCRMDSGSAARELAIAKSFAGEAAQRVAFSAQQLHGGAGVDVDNDLHFYYRRAKALELRMGGFASGLSVLESSLG